MVVVKSVGERKIKWGGLSCTKHLIFPPTLSAHGARGSVNKVLVEIVVPPSAAETGSRALRCRLHNRMLCVCVCVLKNCQLSHAFFR